jgi:flagellar basal-body rod modification protein FlgD
MSIISPTTNAIPSVTTNPVTSQTGTPGTTLAPTGTPGTTLAPTGPGLGQNDFLTLMMDQLKNQDPTSPSDPTQYLSELAQFTSLQQQNSIASSTATAAAGASATSALSLLGHTVTYTDSTGTTYTGAVQKVSFSSSGPSLTVNGTAGVIPSSVTEVS